MTFKIIHKITTKPGFKATNFTSKRGFVSRQPAQIAAGSVFETRSSWLHCAAFSLKASPSPVTSTVPATV